MINVDRRKSERTNLAGHAKLLAVKENEVYVCDTLDVSPGGLGIVTLRALSQDTTCMVSFDIDCRGRRIRINANGIVVATSSHAARSYRTGIRFLDMDSRSQYLLDCFVRHRCNGAHCNAGLADIDL